MIIFQKYYVMKQHNVILLLVIPIHSDTDTVCIAESNYI